MARREFVLWAAVGAYVAAFTFAVIWAQWWTVRQPEPFTPVNVEPWLRNDPADDGPRIGSFSVPRTVAGLERAVRSQWDIVSTLDYYGRAVWGSYECSLVIFDDELDRSALELWQVDIDMTDQATAHVTTRLRPRGDREFVFWKTPRTERWTYRDGAWVNETCSYYDGPSVADMIIDGTIEVLDAP